MNRKVDVYYSLYDRMLQPRLLERAFYGVRKASGSPGIDGQSIADFGKDLRENILQLARELRDKSYQPLPVRRVEIPKEGGGVRKLGIPAVRDRIVQQALLNILQPIFNEDFHPSSYGYRPGRSAHQAITKASDFIRVYNRKWVVDMDLSKCFDTLDHDIIIASFQRRIADGSILWLLREFLESGVMTDEGWQASEVGSPQGGVISPLVANVYLDAFDQFMMSRNHRIVRYADDILILCRSKSAAQNAMKQATEFLEGTLKLTVNVEKTHLVHSFKGVKFLGVIIHTGHTRIQPKKLEGFKEKVRRITRRSSPVNLDKVIRDLNPVLRGFANYFRIADCKRVFNDLMSWTRHRIRAKQMRLWKTAGKLHRKLRQLGHKGDFKCIKMSSWRNSSCPLAHMAMPVNWLREEGLYDICVVEVGIYVPYPR